MLKSLLAILLLIGIHSCNERKQVGPLKLSANKRYFITASGDPFFWLGDTGWLLFSKLNREEVEEYLTDREQKGFNVIQVMVIHQLSAVNAYGDSALVRKNVAHPLTTEGNSFTDTLAYDYWDHIDFVIASAAKHNLYVALVPIWGSNVKQGHVNVLQAKAYSIFLANRYKDKHNIIWVNGGDIKGSDHIDVWKTIGATLRKNDPHHLITFHPRGRTQSSEWFATEGWLDFNMFQSGHRRYDQDTANAEHRYGEDNWKYMEIDYNLKPIRPSLDGEPSYEDIPQGLHDTTQPRWTDKDVRRYGYWSVFSGACGYTYGHNSVMQMHKPSDKETSYGAKDFWFEALDAPGATQMVHLKNLMLSRSYLERIPDQSLVAEQGEKYNYILATRGNDYALFYTYTGRNIKVNMEKIGGSYSEVTWYNPRDGKSIKGANVNNSSIVNFDPPGSPQAGNDWILILDVK